MIDEDKPVYFISDAHLGSGPNLDLRRRTLVDLLSGLKGRASHLYILGDLFDFWFEYRHAIPKGHFQVLAAIADLVVSGMPVAYFGGNHDFWCGSFLREEIGLDVHQQPAVVRHQGRRIFLAHGDGIASGDLGYRLLKGLLRHRLAIALYRMVHPDLGIPFAYLVSKTSRPHALPFDRILRRYLRNVARPRFAEGNDAVVIGHIHTPTHLRDARGNDFLIIGDWLDHFTFVRLEKGSFHLERYDADHGPHTIEPSPWPPAIAAD